MNIERDGDIGRWIAKLYNRQTDRQTDRQIDENIEMISRTHTPTDSRTRLPSHSVTVWYVLILFLFSMMLRFRGSRYI